MLEGNDCVQLHTTEEAGSVIIDIAEPLKINNAANDTTGSTTPVETGQPNLRYTMPLMDWKDIVESLTSHRMPSKQPREPSGHKDQIYAFETRFQRMRRTASHTSP